MTELFDSNQENLWCPGCGNFSILGAMKTAFTRQGLRPRDILIVAGIGQSGKTPHYLQSNLLHGLHGRALALATGAKIADHHLKVVVNAGDGDCYGEGGNHFLAAIRRNVDMAILVHNNGVYGLTKGQASPTTPLASPAKLSPAGAVSTPLNPLATALVNGCGFVARGFSGNANQLTELIVAAMAYDGLALVDIFQPCVSFNKLNTYQWYRDRVYDLDGTDHDATDFDGALKLAMATEKLPTGIFYKVPTTPFHERIPVLKDRALVDHPFKGERIRWVLKEM